MNDTNYYAVLGVRRAAELAEIRRVYVQRLKYAHPDLEQRSPYPQASLEDLQRAYHCLSNAETRSAHDAALLEAELAHASRLRRVQRRLAAGSGGGAKASRRWLKRPAKVNMSRWRLLLIAIAVIVGRELITRS